MQRCFWRQHFFHLYVISGCHFPSRIPFHFPRPRHTQLHTPRLNPHHRQAGNTAHTHTHRRIRRQGKNEEKDKIWGPREGCGQLGGMSRIWTGREIATVRNKANRGEGRGREPWRKRPRARLYLQLVSSAARVSGGSCSAQESPQCHGFGEHKPPFVVLRECRFGPAESMFKKVMYTTAWMELINVLFAKEARYKSACCTGSIFIRYKSRPSGSMLLRVRIVSTLGGGVGAQVGFWVWSNVLFLSLGTGYMVRLKNHCTVYSQCVQFSVMLCF